MYDQRLAERLLAPKPSSVVLVGAPIFRLSESLKVEFSQPDYVDVVPSISKTDGVELYISSSGEAVPDKSNLVMCMDLPVDAPDLESRLGLACRASPQLLLVEQTVNSASEKLLPDEQFFAFGFRIVEKTDDAGRQRALYVYNFSEYKRAPDWLNARFWANPERFGVSE